MKTRLGFLLMATCLFVGPGAAQTLDVVHRFQGYGGAYSRLIQSADGHFYGTTSSGGANGVGSVFKMNGSGTLTTLHSFGYAEGTAPMAALLQATDGNFYGTTSAGGASNSGTVFKMDAAGIVTTLHSFDGNDGGGPSAPLIQAADGNFYGTTGHGGSGGCTAINSCGTVFRMDSSGHLTTLHSFRNTDGSHPLAALLEAADGNFYGTTSSGGSGGYGTVFKMDGAGNVTTLYVFSSLSGANPHGALVQGTDGDLYGTTTFHTRTACRTTAACVNRCYNFFCRYSVPVYGTVFKISTSGMFNPLHTFAAGEGSGSPGGLILASDGNLYGTTTGGTGYIFQVSPSGAFATLYGFTGPDGSNPSAGLLQASDGHFYGTTVRGGAGGVGTVFHLASSGGLTTLYSFPTEGLNPQASLIQAADGAFYGTTQHGGAGGIGTVFKTDSSGALTTLHSFENSEGGVPSASLLQAADGDFYGTTSNGGASGVGTVFKTDSTGALTPLHSFNGSDGSDPAAALIQAADGTFYGTTSNGGANGFGTVFKMDSSGAVATLHDFDGTGGANPYSSLIRAADGSLYGTTSGGGAATLGAVFKITPAGVFTQLHSFNGSDGSSPTAALIQAADGTFYGTTSNGGANGFGTVFAMDSTGNVTTLHTFDGSDGAYPSAALIQAPGGNFYGTTSSYNDYGTIFKVDSSGNLTTLHRFHVADGVANPANLVLGSGGSVWGTTAEGGLETGGGTVFRLVLGAPTLDVTAITPASGPSSGGTLVHIAGAGFAAGARVMIGDSPANAASVGSATVVRALAPELSPGTLNSVTVINVNPSFGTGSKLWFADFLDVPQGDIFHDYVETIFRMGITAGHGNGEYGRDDPVTRAQVAVFLLKAEHGSSYVPPTCTGTFPDVTCPSLFADWIEQLWAEGITAGCGGGLYCPYSSVTRRQMAVFLLKTKDGSGHTPPPATGIFGDVPQADTYAPWIEELYNLQVTGGCQASPRLYCPGNPSTRGQMAVFLVKTFDLQ